VQPIAVLMLNVPTQMEGSIVPAIPVLLTLTVMALNVKVSGILGMFFSIELNRIGAIIYSRQDKCIALAVYIYLSLNK